MTRGSALSLLTSWLPEKCGFGRQALYHGAVVVAALIVVWCGIANNLAHQYSAAQQQAVADSSNLARAYAEHIAGFVEAVDQTLLLVRDIYQKQGAALDLLAFAWRRNPLNGLDIQIGIVDRTGMVVKSSLGPLAEPVNVADRPFFKAQAESLTDKIYIGSPIVGRISHALSIQFLRKLIAPDGAFDGLVVLSVNPLELSRFYETISIGAGSITLRDLSGVVLARAPDAKDSIGRVLETPGTTMMRTGPATGTFTSRSVVDGVRRIYSYRRLDDIGLILDIGLAEADVFAAFRSNVVLSVTVGILLSAGIIGTGLLTFRQRMRLLQSNEKLAVTLENMTQGIELITPDGRVQVINSQAVELLGLPPSLATGKPYLKELLDWQRANGELGPPETWPAKMAQALGHGGVIPGENSYERVRPNGTVLEVRTRSMPDGGAVRTFTDITERKRTEAELANARDVAEASAHARTEFLAMMSHEIRTPMNSIIGCTALLRDMPMSQAAQQYIDIIRRSGEHLLRLIDDVLDLSKLDAGRLHLQSVSFDLRAELAGTVELMASQAKQRGLSLELDMASSVPRRVLGDPGRLRQVLLNLIGNAIKFTSVGHVRVEVSDIPHRTPKRTNQPMDPGTAFLSFRVIDTGIGIPADKIDVLFQSFSQVDASGLRQYGGTGLGLAICKRLIEQMGGTIGVRTEVGRGSVFHFDLPLRVAAEAATGAGASQSADRTPGYCALLADDSDTNRMVIARMLESRGNYVDAVANGRLALDAARTRDYDFIVLDLLMPDMDGLDAAAAIRALPGRRGRVPIIGLTANAGTGDEERCFRAGMDAFMVKPVSADQLIVTIGNVVAKVSARA